MFNESFLDNLLEVQLKIFVDVELLLLHLMQLGLLRLMLSQVLLEDFDFLSEFSLDALELVQPFSFNR